MLKNFHIAFIMRLVKNFHNIISREALQMTCITNIYKKEYSEIADIQRRNNVYYNLVKTVTEDLTYFGIEIILKNEQTTPEKAFFKGISESELQVRDILKFLFENSIKPNVSMEIISDLVSLLEYAK